MRLVVAGGVAAGLSAAARARRLDRSLDILVLEKGPRIAYGACGLPYYIEGQVRDPEQLVLHTPDDFRRDRNIEVRTGTRVAAIAHSRRHVVLESGERIGYDKLVIATGARPSNANIEGCDQPHVFRLHTWEDALRLKQHLRDRRPARAVVIGAGYIGLEMAAALRSNGMAVTIVSASKDVLGRDDEALTEWVAAQARRFHVELLLGAEIRSIEASRAGDVPCDLVLLAAGLQPNVELAVEAGAGLGRTGALRTAETLETNLAGVYAAGDCCETRHLVSGRPVWVPLGTTANKMGRVAGANACGGRERFAGVVGTTIARVFGAAVAVTGLSLAQARSEGFPAARARIEAPDKTRYFRGRKTTVELVADRATRRLLGGTVIGDDGVAGRIGVIATALAAKMTLDDFEQLDLAYAPPYAPVWDPLLVAAQQLHKEME